MIDAASMGHLDRCRRPALGRSHRRATGRHDAPAKEWHHVVVSFDGGELLVNLSESATPAGPVARVIVMAHTDHWHTSVTTAPADEVTIATDRLDARYGADTELSFRDGSYRLRCVDSAAGYDIDVTLVPQSPASMLTGVTLSMSERLSWFFAPRLFASGRIEVGGASFEVDGALAYHDHNWGHFAWGGDYAWEWISVVHTDWSVTASRLLNGSRTTVTSQYLHLESDGNSVTFRDHEIDVVSHGRRRLADVPVVPGAMRLLTPALVEDVPVTMTWSAQRGDHRVSLDIAPTNVARLVMPSERAVDRVVVLAEATGSARLDACLDGRAVAGTGRSILELLR